MNPLRDRLASLLYGIMLPLTALRLIARERKLLAWAVVPFLIAFALSLWGVAWAKAKAVALGAHWLASRGYSSDSFLVHAAAYFLQIALFVLAAIAFSFVTGIVASPFNDFLAEAAEPFADPPLPPAPSAMSAKLRALAIDVVKTATVTALQLVLIGMGIFSFWIPGLNLVPFAAAFWLIAFQFLSYPQTRRGEGLRSSVRFLSRHAFSTFGFGAALGLLFAIPYVASFTLPLAVVGGTLLYARSRVTADPRHFRLH